MESLLLALPKEPLASPSFIVVVAITAIACLLLPVVFWFTSNKKKNETKKGEDDDTFPSLPPTGPVFGDFFESIKAQNQMNTIEKYGNFFTVPSPLPGIVPNIVVVNEPAIVKQLCIKEANMYRNPSRFSTRTSAMANATVQTVGVGVTGLMGEEWHWRKQTILREFHRNRLLRNERGLLSKIVEEGKQLCDTLGEAADSGKPVAVDTLTTRAAVGVVLFFLFGRDLKFDSEELGIAAGDLMQHLLQVLTNPLHSILKYVPGTSSYRSEQSKRAAWKTTDDIIASEIQQLLDEYEGKLPVHPDRKEGSVIESLIANEPRFRKGGVKSMIAEARVFVQAGFETTAHSLAFSMGILAERPDIAEKIASLGKEKLGQNDGYDVDKVKGALNETDLVRNLFLEAVRLYPLAPALGGESTDNVVIETKDGVKYGIPKGTALNFPNMTLQRQVSPDPDEVRPDRWNVKPQDQPFLHTFQTGAHVCPGKPLALLEGHVFLLLAGTAFRFEFPSDGAQKVEYEDNLLLRPKDRMPLLVNRRESKQ